MGNCHASTEDNTPRCVTRERRRFIFVRHGHGAHNEKGCRGWRGFSGQRDPPLTFSGIAQATSLRRCPQLFDALQHGCLLECSPLRRAQDTAFHALDGYAVCVAPYVMESNLAARALSRASHTLAGRVNGSENSALSRAEQWRYQLSGLLHDTQGGYYTHYTQGGYYSFQGGFPRILLFITRGLTVYNKWFYCPFLRGCTCISKALGQVKRAPGRWPED